MNEGTNSAGQAREWPEHTEESRELALRVLAALDSELRIQIVLMLRERDHVVHEMVSRLGTSQPLISQHLRVLKKAGLVDSVRSGRKVIYSLTDFASATLIDDAAAVGLRAAAGDTVASLDDHRAHKSDQDPGATSDDAAASQTVAGKAAIVGPGDLGQINDPGLTPNTPEPPTPFTK